MNEAIPQTLFSTKQFNHSDKLASWQDAISNLFCIDLPKGDIASEFDTQVESYLVGGMMLSNCFSFRQSFARGSKEIIQSGMDHYLVQLYRQGTNQILFSDRLLNVYPGDIQILDLSQNHRAKTADSGGVSSYHFENLSLFIPRYQLEHLIPNAESLHHHVLRSGTPANEIIKSYILTLFNNASSMTQQEATDIAKPTVELVASLLANNKSDALQAGFEHSKIIHIFKTIEQYIGNAELSPAFIASKVGLSRTNLYVLCEPWGGVMHLIKTKRLKLAFSLLRNYPHYQIQEVAGRCGFSNNQVFSRSFKEYFGAQPMEVKYIANNEIEKNASHFDENARFADWMLAL